MRTNQKPKCQERETPLHSLKKVMSENKGTTAHVIIAIATVVLTPIISGLFVSHQLKIQHGNWVKQQKILQIEEKLKKQINIIKEVTVLVTKYIDDYRNHKNKKIRAGVYATVKIAYGKKADTEKDREIMQPFPKTEDDLRQQRSRISGILKTNRFLFTKQTDKLGDKLNEQIKNTALNVSKKELFERYLKEILDLKKNGTSMDKAMENVVNKYSKRVFNEAEKIFKAYKELLDSMYDDCRTME